MSHLDFALFGAAPAFNPPVNIGTNLPSQAKLEAGIRDIFARRYYTNNGPMVQRLDEVLSTLVRSAAAVSVTNDSIAHMVAAKGLELDGEVVVSALAPRTAIEALRWAGLTPVISDVDITTYTLSANTVQELVSKRTSAIIDTDYWDRAFRTRDLAFLAERKGVRLVRDHSGVAGITYPSPIVEGSADADVYSFNPTSRFNSLGACIATNSEDVAQKLRTIRGFGASRTPVQLRCNGKMSEIQATIALLCLDEFATSVAIKGASYTSYCDGLQGLQGIRLGPKPRNGGHYAAVAIEVDGTHTGLDRDCIFDLLRAEGVLCIKPFAPVDRHYANAHRLSHQALLLPIPPTSSDVDRVCALVRRMIADAPAILSSRKRKT